MLKPALTNGRGALDGCRMARFNLLYCDFKPGSKTWTHDNWLALTRVTAELEAEAMCIVNLERLSAGHVMES